jgi:Trk K+ transport system NAD-binding subunit
LPIVGKAIKDLPLDDGASLLLRQGCEPMAHNPATVLEAGDQFILLIRSKNIEPLRASVSGASLGGKQ